MLICFSSTVAARIDEAVVADQDSLNDAAEAVERLEFLAEFLLEVFEQLKYLGRRPSAIGVFAHFARRHLLEKCDVRRILVVENGRVDALLDRLVEAKNANNRLCDRRDDFRAARTADDHFNL